VIRWLVTGFILILKGFRRMDMGCKKLILVVVIAALVLAVSGCSSPAKSGTAPAVSSSVEVTEKIAGFPDGFPDALIPLIAKDPEITDSSKGSDGKTFGVMFKTSLNMDEAHGFYAEKMKGFENFTETKNEFGYVFEGKDGDDSFTVAITNYKDGPVSAIVTVQ
jgi:hypothetical protein